LVNALPIVMRHYDSEPPRRAVQCTGHAAQLTLSRATLSARRQSVAVCRCHLL